MAVRVRDLEIALVLAREMKAAAERSVDASLRLDQLQEVFGVEELDRAERARIQTALQMAGLEPFPYLLEADPAEPIRFGASKVAAAANATAAAPPPPPPPEEPAATEAQPTFPTVGQFARSKLTRRFGVRRGDHGAGDAPPRDAPPDDSGDENGHVPDEVELDIDATRVHQEVDEEAVDQEELPEEVVEDEPVAEEPLHGHDHEPEHEPEHEHEHELEDEREYIPLASPQPVAYAEPEPEPLAPEPQPAATRGNEIFAVLLPAAAIPVIVTSIAGWRFGLPFVALSVIATGWLVGRRSEDGGFFASIRRSPAALTALTVTAVVTVLSVGASVVLISLRDSSSGGRKTAAPAPAPAKKTQQPAASKPTAPPKPAETTKKKQKKASKPQAQAPAAPEAPTPAQDPATQGLVRVPPSSSGAPSQPAPSGTSTTP
ncbi:MAG: hypothetical protein ACJ756_07865 [Solirubrobacterales bacterium]